MSRPIQFNRRKPCYFCGTSGRSTPEHIPAKHLTSLIDCDRITVPSCPHHNLNKSQIDQSIVIWLVRGLEQVRRHGLISDLSPNVASLVESVLQDQGRAGNRVRLIKMANSLPDNIDFELAHIDGNLRVFDWITMLTAGIIWSATGSHENGVDWNRVWNFSPTYIRGMGVKPRGVLEKQIHAMAWINRLFEESGDWHEGWPSGKRPYPKELYNFCVCIENSDSRWPRTLVVRHEFLETAVFYSRFAIDEDKVKMIQALWGGQIALKKLFTTDQ